MRQLLRLFIPLWLALCLLGCGKPKPSSYPPTMVEAARLSEHEAARALPLLEALADSLDRLDEEGRVYYDLLRLRVNDKLNVRATSDTLIRRITAFYEAYGDPDKLMLAYYYRGRVCADLNDALQALHFYRKAAEVSEGKRQPLLLSKIYSQMGEILEYQNMYEEAIPVYRKSYEYTLLSGDSVTLSMPIRDIAGVYREEGQKDSALVYYEWAAEIAERTNHRIYLGILEEMGNLYMEFGEYDKAFKVLTRSLADPFERDRTPTYYLLGKWYMLTGNLDSAFYYTKKSNTKEVFYKEIDVYRNLVTIERGRGHYREALDYWDEFLKCDDSIQIADNSEEILRMKSLYDYNLRERENQRLALANERKQAAIYRLFAITAILLLFLGGGLIHYLNRKRNWQRQTRKLEAEKRRIYRESEERIKDNLQKIAELEALSRDGARSASAGERNLIALSQDILSAENKHIELNLERRRVLEEQLITSAIYAKFHDGREPIDESDWMALRQELDRVYDLTNRLYALNPTLSEMELRICCLIKIRVKVTDMAILLHRSKQAVSNARNRLYSKLSGRPGNPTKLDDLIRDL
ncbi:MAG TPA: tetratricopeptide repeat protein [Candidatus Parabacteroides intestinipullorum]|uniref:Tetratricopeptide repeat protein n=1 Tax=Candidatus Parabacteroides intestinipullorum TaxID=2838723 RepID=A0A9D2BFW3_9BACT|nr:tetratricopeptide repeat protein [Candidatus Parabacteroides intestinipullorum]